MKSYNIQFYVYKNVHWPMFENLYHYLKKQNEVEKIYICLPNIQEIIGAFNYDLINKLLSLDAEIVPKPVKDVDVTFIADTVASKVSGCGKIVNIGHGTISKGYYFMESVWTERENWVDLLCVPGNFAKNKFNKILKTKVVATGMPKLDPVFSGDFNRENLCRKLNLNPNKKIILYSPTFNIDLSSVFVFVEEIQKIYSEEYYVLFKLHGSTVPYLVERYKEIAGRYPNFIFIEDPNIAPYIGGADLMISDVSSAFMEFMALDKPVILYDNPNREKYHGFNIDNIEWKWRDLGYRVSSIDEIPQLIRRIFSFDDKSSIRKSYAKQLFSDLGGNASQNVWNETKKIIHNSIEKKLPLLSIGLILEDENIFSIREIISKLQFYSVVPIELIITVKNSNQRIKEFLQYLTEFNQFKNLILIEENNSFEIDILEMIEKSNGEYFMYLQEDTQIYKNFGYFIFKTFDNNSDILAITGVTNTIGSQNCENFIKNKDKEYSRYAYDFINKYQGKEVIKFKENILPKLWCIKVKPEKFMNYRDLESFLIRELFISPSIYYSSIQRDDFLTLKNIMKNKSHLSDKELFDILSKVIKTYLYSDFAEMILEILNKQNTAGTDLDYLAQLSLISRYYDYELKKRLLKIVKNRQLIDAYSRDLEIIDILRKNNKLITSKTSNLEESLNSKKIMFYFFKNVHIPILLPIYEKLKELYPEINVAFSYLPPTPEIRAGLIEEELNQIKKYNVPIYNFPQDFHPDLTFIADSEYPWVQNCGKLVHVGHGIISKGQYYTNTEIALREEQADLVCVPGKYHEQIMKNIITKPVVATGMAKLDRIFSGEMTRTKVCKKYGLPEDKRYILFAPTFNDELSAIPFVQDRINEVIPDEDTFLIIKLHNSTKKEYKKMYLDLVKKDERVIFADETDISPFLILSDIMISDVSSAMIEFAALNKPVILFNNPNWKKYKNFNPNDIEYNCRQIGIEVESLKEIKRAIKLYSLDKNINSKERNEITDLLVANKYKANAAQMIVEEAVGRFF